MTPPDYTGKYVDLRLIGQGGFGSVWWAWDPGLKRPVAIKVMLAQLAEDEAWVARFQQEVRFMAQVDGHPNIVRVIELHQDEHGLSIVMDYCPNGNLEDLIRSEGPIPGRFCRLNISNRGRAVRSPDMAARRRRHRARHACGPRFRSGARRRACAWLFWS